MAKTQHVVKQDVKHFDYKDVEVLRQFLNPHGRIISRRRNGLNAKQQRALEGAIKRSRIMGLIPFIQK
jgi:small subunit ribosomal protein S18